MTDYNLLSGGE